MIGGNFRLDVIQAAILMVKLPHLDSWSQARRNNAEYYSARFAGSAIRTPIVAENCVSILNRYGIRVPNRKELVAHMKELQVGFEIYYPLPLHLQSASHISDTRPAICQWSNTWPMRSQRYPATLS